MFETLEGKPLPEVETKPALTFWDLVWAIFVGLWAYSISAAVVYFAVHTLL